MTPFLSSVSHKLHKSILYSFIGLIIRILNSTSIEQTLKDLLVWKCAMLLLFEYSWAPTLPWLHRDLSHGYNMWTSAKWLGKIKSSPFDPPGWSHPPGRSIIHLVPSPASLKRAFLCPLLQSHILDKDWEAKDITFLPLLVAGMHRHSDRILKPLGMHNFV